MGERGSAGRIGGTNERTEAAPGPAGNRPGSGADAGNHIRGGARKGHPAAHAGPCGLYPPHGAVPYRGFRGARENHQRNLSRCGGIDHGQKSGVFEDLDRAGTAGLCGRPPGVAGAGNGLFRGPRLHQAPRSAPWRPAGTFPERVPPPAGHRVRGNLRGHHLRPAGGGRGGNGGRPGPAARRVQGELLPHRNPPAEEPGNRILGGLPNVCVSGPHPTGPRREKPVPDPASHGPGAGGGPGHPVAHGGL